MASILYRGAILARLSGPRVLSAATQVRNLNVQEHISYQLLNEYCISTPKFGVAHDAREAKKIAEELKSKDMVLKAQVLAGGRGKGHFKGGLKSGVRVIYTPEEAEKTSGRMIGDVLVTKQTGAIGKPCNKVMVAERKFNRKEYYMCIMMERSFNGPVLIASSQGGVNIEEVAAEDPTAITYEPIDYMIGLTQEQAQKIVCKLGLDDVADKIVPVLLNMYKLFVEKDALMVEINPFAEDICGDYFALDAKLRFDDNAAFRQKELFELRDFSQEDEREVAASKFDLNYISLDGRIGCLVNGAGLAMATMDIIKLYGGDPANFLDVGGGATAEAVKEAFQIISSDDKVHSILVNIFGGIMRCDVIAEGIIAAAKELDLKIPIVVRLQGTNVEEAREMIKASKLRILPRDDLDEAAALVVALSDIVHMARKVGLGVNFEIPEYFNN